MNKEIFITKGDYFEFSMHYIKILVLLFSDIFMYCTIKVKYVLFFLLPFTQGEPLFSSILCVWL